ncbi:hypothetical protein HD554DRAFT_2175563 [Boletus coccyginus]|nr:hypothetical protein HD554DRAFT_2175563 [Boletus coccyginus]
MEPQCPLCCSEFSPSDVCKLCVDGDVPNSTIVTTPLDMQIQRLLDDIATIANRNATVEEMERAYGPSVVLDEIRNRLTFELEAARLQYRNSEQARYNERERASRREEALRVYYEEKNARWRRPAAAFN